MENNAMKTMTDAQKADAVLAALIKKNDDKICCTELPLYQGNTDMPTRRVDLWTLSSGRSNIATSYEIKVSRADFLRDSKEKQLLALAHSHVFYYVAPKGLLNKREIPDWAGFMEYDLDKKRWRTHLPQRRTRDDLPPLESPDWRFIISVVRGSTMVRKEISGMRKVHEESKNWLRFEIATRDHQLIEAYNMLRILGWLRGHRANLFSKLRIKHGLEKTLGRLGYECKSRQKELDKRDWGDYGW